MAENISETRPPEPPPTPPELPKPTEQPSGSEASAGGVPESLQSAHQDARDAARSEYEKATSSREQDGLRPEPEVQTQPDARTATERDRDASASQESMQTQLPEDAATPAEADKPAEIAAQLDELRAQGHGPQRHHDPTDAQLAGRLGEPVLDQQTGEPVLKDNGHVRAQNQIDPMTGTTVDGVHGGVHRCGDYATRFNSPEDYVAADRFMRQQIGDTGPAQARRPISEVLDSTAHERMTGYHHDPDAAGELKPVDFTGGTIFALYERLPNGELKLRTMYADPAPRNPDQAGGTG